MAKGKPVMAFGIAESQVKTGDRVVTSSGELVEQVSELSLVGSSGGAFLNLAVHMKRGNCNFGAGLISPHRSCC